MTRNQKMHWTARGLGVLAAVLVANYGTGVGVNARGYFSCQLMCGEGEPAQCPANFHKAWAPSGTEKANGSDANNGTHSECFNYSCADAHGGCTPDPELVDQATHAIDTGDGAALRRLLSEENVIKVNKSRGAFQFETCNGSIFANLPAAAKLLEVALDRR